MTWAPENETELEAALWVAKMDGAWSTEQAAELETWLAGDTRRSGTLLRAHAMWLTGECVVQQTGSETKTNSGLRRGFHAHRREILAGGAGAVAATLIAGFGWMARANVYRTGVGEIRHVPLADGSVATINTASGIDVDLGTARRDVRLERGEAWFQVAKDATRPFVVQAGAVSVEAIGTAFSVRRRADGAEVLVSEGVVAAWSAADAKHRIELIAGDRAVITDAAMVRLEPTAPSTIDRALAWRAGMIDLMGEPLSQAIAEINRYNHQQLVLADPRLAGEEFDGVFRADDPQGFARAVQASLGVPVDFDDPAYIRIGRASG